MQHIVERMTKVDFDGFILLLERLNWAAFPLENNADGWQAAAEWSVIHKLRSDTDYARVYDMYDRYRSMRKFSELAQRYKDELIAFREQCYGASKAQTFLSVIVTIPSSLKASPEALRAPQPGDDLGKVFAEREKRNANFLERNDMTKPEFTAEATEKKHNIRDIDYLAVLGKGQDMPENIGKRAYLKLMRALIPGSTKEEYNEMWAHFQDSSKAKSAKPAKKPAQKTPMALIAEKHELAKPKRKKATKTKVAKKTAPVKEPAPAAPQEAETLPAAAESTGTVLQHDKVENGATYPDIWDASITEFDFNSRARRMMMGSNIQLIGQLISRTSEALQAIPNMGKATLDNIKYVLSQYNLTLGTDVGNWAAPGGHSS